jgi:hypothetical protein
MIKVQTEHEQLAQQFGAIRARLEACRTMAAANGNDADALASAIAAHLLALDPTALPAAAHVVWTERVARPLKSEPAKPLSARAVASIRSWPSARIGQLVDALSDLEAMVLDAENDAEHEVIYAEISRTYS